jgi:hypothetical protein
MQGCVLQGRGLQPTRQGLEMSRLSQSFSHEKLFDSGGEHVR